MGGESPRRTIVLPLSENMFALPLRALREEGL